MLYKYLVGLVVVEWLSIGALVLGADAPRQPQAGEQPAVEQPGVENAAPRRMRRRALTEFVPEKSPAPAAETGSGTTAGTTASAVPPAGLEPTLGKKGRLLLEEKFDGTTLPTGWNIKAGGLRVEAGTLHASQDRQAGRLGLFNCEVPMQDAVIQIDFKFDGCRGLNVSVNPSPGEVDKKGHLYSVMITPAMWNITEHNNKADRASQSVALSSAREVFEQGKWYTLLVENKGDEVIARIEGKQPLRASSKDFRAKKPGIEFRVLGRDNEEVSFDNLRVWELK